MSYHKSPSDAPAGAEVSLVNTLLYADTAEALVAAAVADVAAAAAFVDAVF